MHCGAGAPIRNAGNQADAQLDSAVTDVAKGAKKAADNITPDLSELPSPGQLANKVCLRPVQAYNSLIMNFALDYRAHCLQRF